MTMDAEIKDEFTNSGFSLSDEEQILKKCLTFCINYKLTASDLVTSWEIYYLNRQLTGSVVEDAQMDGFLSHLQNQQLECVEKEEPMLHVYSSNDVDMIPRDSKDDQIGFLETPQKVSETPQLEVTGYTPGTDERVSASVVSRNRVTPFAQRLKKFSLHTRFNIPTSGNSTIEQNIDTTEDEFLRKVKPAARCTLHVLSSQPQPGCKFMYDRIEKKFNSLEDRIKRHALALASAGLFRELSDATISTQTNVFVVGMVCCTGEGHLNEKSVLLQGSVEHSAGHRVRLDLQKLDQFSLFPGQIVGIEGNNPSGHCLIASRIVDTLPGNGYAENVRPLKMQARDRSNEFLPRDNEQTELSLVIASGPFTTTDNLLFEPLVELLAYARRKQPQLLLLMGPFIDSEHPEIKKGTVDRSFDEIFLTEIVKRLQDYVEYMAPAASVILAPSVRDANHDFVFPQPPFAVNVPEDLKNHIVFLPNPGLFTANEVTVGCCTIDILKQLSSEEIQRKPIDRMGRLATHLLCQRSFYPLYPPYKGIPLDLSLAPEALWIECIPELLVLPSDLGPFVKLLPFGEVGNNSELKCLCINPGRLAKGVGGGTFVELNYHKNMDKSTASVIKI